MLTWKKWVIVAAVLAFLVWAWLWGVPLVTDLVVRGARLTTTELDAAGNIAADPHDLALAAAAVVGVDVSDDEYAAARMVRSEEPRQTDFVKRCLVQTLINDANHLGWSLVHTLTFDRHAAGSGHFGHQSGRRYSTKDDPYDGDLAVAKQAIADHHGGVDDTNGARKFVNKWSFGPTGNTYDGIVASWAGEGLHPFTIDGVPSHIVFFNATGTA